LFHVLLETNNQYFPVQHSPIGLPSDSAVFSVRYETNLYISCTIMYIIVNSAVFAYCSHMYILCRLCLTHTHTHTHTKTFDTKRNRSPTEDAPTCLRVQWTVNKVGGRGGGGDRRQRTDWLLAADWLDLELPYSSK
jgi:hypothetical protein